VSRSYAFSLERHRVYHLDGAVRGLISQAPAWPLGVTSRSGTVRSRHGRPWHARGRHHLEETNNNLAAFAGIACNARLLPVKVCYGYWEIQIVMASLNLPGFADPDDGGCATSDVIAGIRYAADNGAQVINLSIGGPGQSSAELDAIRYAVGKGAFVAMAAGNGFDSDNPPEYPQHSRRKSTGDVGRGRRSIASPGMLSNTGATSDCGPRW
jgi:hypothetical protein